jgi:protein disulfide isomerase
MLRRALLAAAAATASQTTPTPDIIDLNDNITHTLSEHEVAVVNFYAPWCAHCIRFEGEYALAASKVPQVAWARLDCALHRETSEIHKVEGYPHVKLYRYGRFALDYEGPNEAHQLARWVVKRSTPHVDELRDWSDARPFLASLFGDDNNKGVRGLVVGVFASNASTAAQTFAQVASGDDGDDLSFALTTKPELVAQALRERDHTISLDLNQDRVHVLSSTGDDVKTMQVDSSTTARAIASFVNSALEPAVTRFDSSTAAHLFHGMRGPRVHALLFVDEASKKGEGVADVFAALASEERLKVRHVVVPSSEARVLKHFDLNSGFDLPTVILCDLRGLAPSIGDDEVVLDDARDAHVTSKKAFAYRLRDWHASNIVDRATLQSFYAAFFDGNLTTPFLRSQPIVGSLEDAPMRAREASEEGRVVTLVGKTWDAVVEAARRDEDDARDFLVLFHAPWCGHCVQLMPVWAQLAELYRRVHSIVIASIDATQNEIQEVDIDQFPSIYLFDARGSPPVLYEGALDLDALSRFLKQRGTRAFDVDGLRGGGELRDEL